MRLASYAPRPEFHCNASRCSVATELVTELTPVESDTMPVDSEAIELPATLKPVEIDVIELAATLSPLDSEPIWLVVPYRPV